MQNKFKLEEHKEILSLSFLTYKKNEEFIGKLELKNSVIFPKKLHVRVYKYCSISIISSYKQQFVTESTVYRLQIYSFNE